MQHMFSSGMSGFLRGPDYASVKVDNVYRRNGNRRPHVRVSREDSQCAGLLGFPIGYVAFPCSAN